MMKRKERVATQFNRPKGDKQPGSASAKTRRRAVEVRRPWTAPQFQELSKEQREIVLDRVAKEVAAPLRALPALRPLVVRGANEVTRALSRGELGVVVLASNPDALLFGHVPLACRLRNVPICVLHASSKALGKIFELKSLSVFGIVDPMRRASLQEEQKASAEQQDKLEPPEDGKGGGADSETAQTALTPEQQARLISIMEFLQSKASKKT